MDIVIIGAGLAGLTTAWELSKSGHHVTVLEARNRVGGRSWSHRLDNGTWVERGGEFIFPTEFAIRKLAAEFEVPILTHNVRYGRRTTGGRTVDAVELQATMDKLRATTSQMLRDEGRGVSVERVGAAALGSGYAAHPVYRRIATSLAADPAAVSAEATLLHDDGPYIEDGGRLVGGNQSLTLTIARHLGDAIRLEHPVAGIDQSPSGVQIALTDGTRMDADAAVVAVPLPVLRHFEFGFDLAERQRAALNHRFMGTAAKLAVPLAPVADDPAVRNTAVSAVEDSWWSWRSLGTDGVHRVPALSCFAGGPAALEVLGVDDGPQGWVDALHGLRPGLQTAGDVLLTTWSEDPWAQGAYSAAGLDWLPEDIDAFSTTTGRVAIAGEHTGLEQSLSGAVASGYRAARAMQVALS